MVSTISSRIGKDDDFTTGLIADKILLLRNRNELMRQRYTKIYRVDFCKEQYYDLVIDSEIYSPIETVELISSDLQFVIQ